MSSYISILYVTQHFIIHVCCNIISVMDLNNLLDNFQLCILHDSSYNDDSILSICLGNLPDSIRKQS